VKETTESLRAAALDVLKQGDLDLATSEFTSKNGLPTRATLDVNVREQHNGVHRIELVASFPCQLADQFQSKIELAQDERRASATEALELALLAAECGSQIRLQATGPDAEEAVNALAKLFADAFGLRD